MLSISQTRKSFPAQGPGPPLRATGALRLYLGAPPRPPPARPQRFPFPISRGIHWSRSETKYCVTLRIKYEIRPGKVVLVPICYLAAEHQIWPGINNTFLPRNYGAALTQPWRRTQQSLQWCGRCMHGPLVSFFERDVLERLLCTVSARNGRVVECQSSPPRSCGDCQQSDVAKLARRMATRAPTNGRPRRVSAVSAPCEGCPMCIHPDDRPRRTAARCQCVARAPASNSSGAEQTSPGQRLRLLKLRE